MRVMRTDAPNREGFAALVGRAVAGGGHMRIAVLASRRFLVRMLVNGGRLTWLPGGKRIPARGLGRQFRAGLANLNSEISGFSA